MSIEKALGKLRAAQMCHPNAVQALIDEAITAIQQAEAQQPAAGEPVLFIHPDTFAMNNAHVGAWKPGHELTGYIPLYTHPAPSEPDGYVLVPIEPTQAMMNVQTWDFSSFYSPREIWAAMLAAKERS